MKVVIEIKCDNAAFEEDMGEEIARILRGLSRHLPDDLGYVHPDPVPLFDVNGNRVGEFRMEDEQ